MPSTIDRSASELRVGDRIFLAFAPEGRGLLAIESRQRVGFGRVLRLTVESVGSWDVAPAMQIAIVEPASV